MASQCLHLIGHFLIIFRTAVQYHWIFFLFEPEKKVSWEAFDGCCDSEMLCSTKEDIRQPPPLAFAPLSREAFLWMHA